MSVFDSVYNQIWMRYYKVKIGKNFSCKGRLIIQGHGEYEFGDNLKIHSVETSNPVGGNRTVFQTIHGGKIKIGNNVGLSHVIICARKSIIIDDNVMLGGGTKIYDNDFHPIDPFTRLADPNGESVQCKSVHIKNGAFIGAHTIILKGVTIGSNAIVGAGSVVTKDIPDNEIWGGNPARFIRTI